MTPVIASLIGLVAFGTAVSPYFLLYLFPIVSLFPNAYQFVFTPDDYALIGMTLAFVAAVTFRGAVPFLRAHLHVLAVIGVFLAWTLVVGFYHTLTSSMVPLTATLKGTVNIALRAVFPFVVAYFVRDEKTLWRCFSIVLACGWLLIGVHTWIVVSRGEPTALRTMASIVAGSGTWLWDTVFFNANHFSRYLYFAFPVAFFVMVRGGRSARCLGGLFVFAASASIVMTASRMASLMIVFLLVMAALFFRQKRWLIVGGIAAALFLVAFSGVTTKLVERFSRLENVEDQNRVIMAVESARIISEHPIAGTGPGTFARLMLQTGLFEEPKAKESPEGKAAHNNLLFLAVQYGITAAAMFTLIYLVYAVMFWRRARGAPHERALFFGGVMLLIAFQGAGMSASMMGYNYFYYLLGLFYAGFRIYGPGWARVRRPVEAPVALAVPA
jgi:O-antigen ligase